MSRLIPFNKNNNNHVGTGLKDFNNMLEDFLSEGWLSGRGLSRDTFKLDINEIEQEYQIEAELPGISKDDIDLYIDNEILTISANSETKTEQDSKNFIHKERRVNSMSRSIHLAGAKAEGIMAVLKEGVLKITVPKEEKKETARKIKIS